MTEKIELLPCPFCGGRDVSTFGPVGWYRRWGISHSCKSFYSGTSDMMQGFHCRESAVEAWNLRVSRDTCISSAEADRDLGKVTGRWRSFEDVTSGYWGIEYEQADNDDDPIMYPIKVHRDTVARIVEAHNAALSGGEHP